MTEPGTALTTFKEELSEIAIRIRKRMPRVVEEIIAIGDDLIAAKKIVGHNNFRGWINDEFNWSTRTAQNFMNMARKARESAKFTHLDIPISAFYLLSAPSTPRAAIEAVGERSEQGEKLSLADVKGEIARAEQSADPLTYPVTPDYIQLDRNAKSATRSLVRALERFGGCSVDDARLKSLLSSEIEMTVIFSGQDALNRALAIVVGARAALG